MTKTNSKKPTHTGINRRDFIGASVLLAGLISETGVAQKSVQTPAIAGGSLGLSNPELSRKISQNSVKLEFSDLDSGTIERTRNRLIDLVGCVIGGSHATGNAALVELYKGWGGTPECTIAGYSGKLPAPTAAMINAISSRSFDFEVMSTTIDDRVIASHTSPTTVMTALAMGERHHSSGADVITALTIGDDLVARIIGAAGFDFGEGWDAASVHSGLGSALISAKLMKLDVQQTLDSLALSVNHLSGTIQAAFDGTTDWKLPQGSAARNGIVSAELASVGWTGMNDPITAPYGFYHQYTGGLVKPEVLTNDLGKKFYAEEYFKPYPACAATHTAIECAIDICEQNALKPEDIQEAVVKTDSGVLSIFVGKPYIAGRYPHSDAIFSLQFQVANILLNGKTIQEHYHYDALRSSSLAAMTERVKLVAFSEEEIASGGGSIIEVSTKDGRYFSNQQLKPKRHATVQVASKNEIVAKFMQQIEFSGTISKERAEDILDIIDNLENIKDASTLMDKLSV